MRVAGCFLQHDDKFVILLRHGHKPDGNTWGLPSGKVEVGESDEEATIRELAEETGYTAEPAQLNHVCSYEFISSSGKPYTYIAYRVKLEDKVQIALEDTAHSDYKWVSAEECDARTDLIPGFHELLRLAGYIT